MSQQDINYQLLKLSQGLHHFYRLGGLEWTTVPKQLLQIEKHIYEYVHLNHHMTKLPQFGTEVKELTEELMDKITDASKETWLHQAQRAEDALIQLNPTKHQLQTAMTATRGKLTYRLGKKVIPTLNLIENDLYERFQAVELPPKPTHQLPPRETTPPPPIQENVVIQNLTEVNQYFEDMKSSKITFLDDKEGPYIKAQGHKDPLSNFYPHAVELLGHHFKSNEQAYQFFKAVHHGEHKIANTIKLLHNPYEIKKQGNLLNERATLQLKGNWDKIKVSIMQQLMSKKADTCKIFTNKLIQSTPKNILHCVGDKFWGVTWNAALKKYIGCNIHGKLLMLLRHRINEQWTAVFNTIKNNQPGPPTSQNIPPSTQSEASTTLPTQILIPNAQPNPINDTGLNTASDYSADTTLPTQILIPNAQPNPINDTGLNTASDYSADTSGDIDESQFEALHRPTNFRNSLSSNASDQELLKIVEPQLRVLGAQSYTHYKDHHAWELPALTQKLAILGDSNIKNITETPNDQLSVETHSYAGARPTHFTAMFTFNTARHTNTEQVILSVGINSRKNAPTYNREEITKMFRAYKQWAPQTKKAVAQVQTNPNLKPYELRTIELFNQDLAEIAQKFKIQVLPTIPQEQFSTRNDKIHWTNKTANAIAKTWVSVLNFQTPSPVALPP